MKFLIIGWLIYALIVAITCWLLPGAHVDSFWTAMVVALVLAISNSLIRPFLILITLPITIFTLCLFLLVINVIIIYLVDGMVDGFTIDGFLWALLFSFIVSALSKIFSSFSKDN